MHLFRGVRSALLIAGSFAASAAAGCAPEGGRGPSTFFVPLQVPPFTVAPGSEVFPCYYTSVPGDAASAVVRVRASMTEGSHHLILFRTREALRPDGTLEDCGSTLAFGGEPERLPQWIFAAQEPEASFSAPDGVGIPLPPGSPVVFSLHYANAGEEELEVSVTLDLEYAAAPVKSAGSIVTYAPDIHVAPQAEGMATGHCALPPGARVFLLTTHSHRFTTSAQLDRWAGGVALERLLTTDDWEHPAVATWSSPEWLTFGPDEELAYTCRYRNTTDDWLDDGESALADEMCMAIGWYYPSGGANTWCVGSQSATF